MKVTVVFKEFSDHGGETLEWIEEFQQRGGDVEKVNPETKEGEGFCQAHGIMDYPAVVVSGGDGKDYFTSVGKPLPTFNEVLNYVLN